MAAAVRIEAGHDEHHERIAAVVARHEHTLLRVARQHSLCDDDALDAYQRALEIFVRRVATVNAATEVAWLKVVVRHEAMAIRRARSQLVASDEVDLDAVLPIEARSVEDQRAATERVRQSAEALRALKPDEAKALVMKAHGLSYDEIGSRYGWSYTKVNRSITEGRRRFLDAYEGIDSGRHCDQFADTLQALADGRATPRQLLAIRPHLRHCAGCRSTVGALRLSRLRRALLFLPLVSAKHTAYELLHRSSASDVALGVQAASASGGGRLATAAAVLGLCVSGAGVGTVCAVSGLLDAPSPKPARSATAHQHTPKKTTGKAPSAKPPAAKSAHMASTIRATPAPTATPRASNASSKPQRNGRKHDAKTVAENEFGFEQTTAAPPTTAQASSASVSTRVQPPCVATAADARTPIFRPGSSGVQPMSSAARIIVAALAYCLIASSHAPRFHGRNPCA